MTTETTALHTEIQRLRAKNEVLERELSNARIARDNARLHGEEVSIQLDESLKIVRLANEEYRQSQEKLREADEEVKRWMKSSYDRQQALENLYKQLKDSNTETDWRKRKWRF